MKLYRLESFLFGRTDSAKPITAKEVSDQLDCGILISYRMLSELEETGVIDSREVAGVRIWWVPEQYNITKNVEIKEGDPQFDRRDHIVNSAITDTIQNFCEKCGLGHLSESAIEIISDVCTEKEFLNAEKWDRERWIAAAVRVAAEQDEREITYTKLSEFTEKANSSQIQTRTHILRRKLSDTS